MGLRTYHAKRDFSLTPEPAGGAARTDGKHRFVIQEHHASRLHYDFRLEVEGVLKSWAVPKEPSLDPAVKRLAVQVEDHPLEYASFHGKIPPGQYGAGRVEIWDKGTYDNRMADKPDPLDMTQSLKKGHVEVQLHGRRLKGAFALVRADHLKGSKSKPQWLLIKMKDAQARRGSKSSRPATRKKSPTETSVVRSSAPPPPKAIEFTHEQKVMFPQAGISKGDLLAYYEKMADRLLPYLRNRPITLERLPDGLSKGAPHFWQKNVPDYYPDWIPRVELKTEEGKPVAYALVNDIQTLLYLVNQGAVTFHTYFSTVQHLDRPDFVLFDLDPGQADFSKVITIARTLHDILVDDKVEAFIKTSGKSGLHVLTPPPPNAGYDQARAWAETIAARVVERLPQIATVQRLKNRRAGRVYIDVVQNALGHHAVPPWVVRAVPEATVSTPLNWKDLTPSLDRTRFTMKAALAGRRRRDPMAGLLRS